MTGWKTVKIGDTAKVISGYAFKKKDFQPSGIPVIKIKNIRVGTVDLEETDFVLEQFLSLDDKYHIKKGDILVSLTGSYITQPNSVVGRVAYFRNDGNYLLNQRAGKFLIKDNYDKKFLFYVFSHENVRNRIASVAYGAANQANVSPSQVEDIEINAPSFATQKKIASILSAYDDLIELNERRIKILEEMAKLFYKDWFVKFRFPGYEKVKMTESGLGIIPEGWEVRSILGIEAVNLIKAKVKRYDGVKEYFATANVEGNNIIKDGEMVTYDERPSRAQMQPEENTIWFAKMRETFKVLCFTSANKKKADNSILSTGFAGLKVNKGILGFIYFTVNSKKFHLLKDQYCTGATQMSSTVEGLSLIKIVLPNKNVIRTYSELTQPMIDQIIRLQQQNSILRQTRDMLSPKLISGEIEVK